jgi:hypothetical protein
MISVWKEKKSVEDLGAGLLNEIILTTFRY